MYMCERARHLEGLKEMFAGWIRLAAELHRMIREVSKPVMWFVLVVESQLFPGWGLIRLLEAKCPGNGTGLSLPRRSTSTGNAGGADIGGRNARRCGRMA